MAQRSRPDLRVQWSQAWDVSVLGWLRFQPQLAAREIPLRAEFSAEFSAVPCELEDLTCLEEFAESEREASSLLGALE